jgi:hypothetical protein
MDCVTGSTGYASVLGRCSVPISAAIATILTEVLRGFLQSLKANVEIEYQIRLRSLPFASFPIHYSLITTPFDLKTLSYSQ